MRKKVREKEISKNHFFPVFRGEIPLTSCFHKRAQHGYIYLKVRSRAGCKIGCSNFSMECERRRRKNVNAEKSLFLTPFSSLQAQYNAGHLD
jgi:hypothetical protein